MTDNPDTLLKEEKGLFIRERVISTASREYPWQPMETISGWLREAEKKGYQIDEIRVEQDELGLWYAQVYIILPEERIITVL